MEATGWQKVNQVLGSLRSWKIGEQCENIVKLPAVFEEYPFPILVDAAFLKLGDIFRECNNNFIRFCILKVILTTTQHHHKISGKEIFLRPVLSVLHSNDAVARAITLRVLGVTASLFPDKRNVLHGIVRGLDSHVKIERDAAIFACKKYAELSQEVSKTVVPKLEELMSTLSTPIAFKIKILDVFQSMNYDFDTAQQVRKLCFKLIKEQNSEALTEGSLKTLTQMMLSTLTYPDELISLLFEQAFSEPRKSIRLVSFKCLCKVAKSQPAFFKPNDIKRFTLLDDNATNKLASEVLYIISCSPAKRLLEKDMFNVLSSKFDSDLQTAVVLFLTCANLDDVDYSEMVLHFQPLLIKSIDEGDIGLTHRLLVAFSKLPHSDNDISSTVSLLFTILTSCSKNIFIEVCYCLAAIRDKIQPKLEVIQQVLALLTAESDLTKSSHFCKLLIVLYKKPYSSPLSAKFTDIVQPEIISFVKSIHESNPWTVYCMSRVAMTNGMFGLGQHIFEILKEKEVHEYSRYFFRSVQLVCEAEVLLQADTISIKPSLIKCIEVYEKGITVGKCCKGSPQTRFQTSYLQLRCTLLKIYLQFVNLYNISLLYGTDHTDNYKPTLRFIESQLSDFNQAIYQLKSCMIDAEKDEIRLNEFLVISNTLSVICSGKIADNQIRGSSQVFEDCNSVICVLKHNPTAINSLSFIKQTIHRLVDMRMCLPIFYFIQPASTTISLATSPIIEGGIIKVAAGCDLVLKIEGVVRGNASHRIKHALINILCDIQSINSSNSKSTGNGSDILTLHSKEVEIENDYLKMEVCIDVLTSSQLFTITASAIDDKDNVWDIGSELSFRVKTDDSVLTKAQMSKSYA